MQSATPSQSSPSSPALQPGEWSGETPTQDIYLLGLPEPAQAAAQQAAHRAFSHGRIRTVSGLREVKVGENKHCLVVLGDPEAATTLIAQAGGSPPCAVVVLGGELSDVAETVPPEEWNPPLLARVFRSALLEYELVRENIRLRGDLKTVARRVSHDLRTPLGCIYTTADVFRELPSGDAESAASMAGIVKESVGEISQIVDRVSFVLKASADPLAPNRVDMGGILGRALQHLDSERRNANAEVTLPASWPEVLGVTTWLQVVWSNLLCNAFQHGGPSARVTIAWQEENGRCRFSITDQGGGVPESKQAGLFTPFDQLHDRHISGLGLCLVERLVSLQGGQCGHEKSPAQGATLYFTLPISR